MSTTVDNRVVEMQFKNEDFERGIKQTITSLDGLKKALEINTNSLDMSRIQHEVDKLNLTNIMNAVQALTDRFSTFGVVGMSVLNNLTTKAFGLVEKLGQISIGQIMSGGKARAQKVADARFKLDGLLKDAEKVTDVFNSAKDAVNDTAFGLDEAANIASMLVGSGVEFKKVGDEASDLDTALRGIAGAAAMSNSSFEDIGRIFAQVKTAGRLMGQDMMQLQGRTINVVAELSKYLNKSQAEVQEMVHKGEIDFNTFAAAMDNSFGAQAKKSNETLQGVLANVRAALSRIGEIFYSGIIENKDLIAFFGTLKDRISALQAALTPLKEPFAKLVSSIAKLGAALLGIFGAKSTNTIEKFVDFIVNVIDKMTSVVETVTKKFDDMSEKMHLKEAVKEVKETVEDIRKASDEVKEIANTIWFGNNIYGNGQKRKDALGKKYKEVQDYVNAMKQANFDEAKADEIYSQMAVSNAKKVTEAKKETAEATKESSESVKKTTESMGLFDTVFSSLVIIFKNVVKSVTAVGKAFKKVFKFKEIKSGIAGIVLGFASFIKAIEITDERASKIQTLFEGVFGIIKMVGEAVANLAAFGFGALAKVLPKIIDTVFFLGEKFGIILTKIREFVTSNNLLVRAGKFIIETFKKVAEVMSEFFSKFVQLPAVQKLKEEFIDIYQKVGKRLIGFFGEAKTAVGDFFGSMSESDASTMDRILGGINTALETFLDLSKRSSDNIKGFFAKFEEGGELEQTSKSLADVGTGYKTLKKQGTALAKSKSIADFLTNMRAATGDTGEKAKDTVSQITKAFSKLDVAKLALLGLSGALVTFTLSFSYAAIGITDAVKKFATYPQMLVGAIQSVRGAFDGVRDYFRKKGLAKEYRELAIALAILAASMAALTFVDQKKLRNVSACMTALLIVLTVMVGIIESYSKVDQDAEEFNKKAEALSKILLSLSASIFLLAASMYTMSNITWNKDMFISLGVLLGMMGVLIGVVAAVNALGPQIKTSGVWLIFYAGSVFLLVSALKLLAKLDIEGIQSKLLVLAEAMAIVATVAIASSRMSFGKGLAVLAIVTSLILVELAFKWLIKYGLKKEDITKHLDSLVILLVGLALIAGYLHLLDKAVSKKPEGVAAVMLATIIAIIAITKSLQKLSKVDKLLGPTMALIAIMTAMAGLIYVIGRFGQGSRIKQAGTAMLKLSVALGLMSLVLTFLGAIPQSILDQGMLAITYITVLLGALVYVTKYAGNIDYKSFIAMIGVMATMAILVGLMSFIEDKKELLKAAGIFAGLLISFGFAMYLATKEARKTSAKPIENMVLALVVISASLIALTSLNKGDYLTMLAAAASLSLVLIALGRCAEVMMKAFATKGVGEAKMKQVNKSILVMTAIIGSVGAALSLMTFVADGKWATVLASAGAMIAVLSVMVLLYAIISKKLSAGKTVVTKIQNLSWLLIALAGISVAMTPLLYFGKNGVQIILAAASLVAVLAALTGVYAILNVIKGDGKQMVGKAVALGLVSVSLIPAAYALSLLAKYDWKAILISAGALAGVVIAISAALALLSLVGKSGAGAGIILAMAAAISLVALSLAFSAKIVSTALMTIVKAVKKLTTIEYDKIDIEKLSALVGVLAKLSLTSLLTSVAITLLGASLIVLGTGVAVLGAGLSLIIMTATGLVKAVSKLLVIFMQMTSKADEIADGIKLIASTAGNSLKQLGKDFALGFVIFLKTLEINARVIGLALKNLVLTIIDILFESRIEIVKKIIDGITDMFDMLSQELPEMFQKIADVILVLLEQVAINAKMWGYLGSIIAVEFLTGLAEGLAEEADDLIDSTVYLTLSIIKAIKDTFEKYKDILGTSVESMYSKASAAVWKGWKVNAYMMGMPVLAEFADEQAKYLEDNAVSTASTIDQDLEKLSEERGKKNIESYNKGQKEAVKNTDTTETTMLNEDNVEKSLNASDKAASAAEETVDSYTGKIGEKAQAAKDYLHDKLYEVTSGGTQGAKEGTSELTEVASMPIDEMSEEQIAAMQKAGWKLNEETGTMVKQIPKAIKEGVESSETSESFDLLGSVLDPEGDGAMGQIFSKFTGNMGSIADEGGSEFVNGLVGKFQDKASLDSIYQGTYNLGEQAKAGWDASTDTNSPSKEAIKRGGYWIDGLLVALTSNKASQSLYKASYGNAEEIKNSFTTAISNMPGFGNDMVYTPTIRPVLDDSNMDQFNGMLNVLDNPTTFKMAADSQLSINDANQFRLAQQIEGLRADINKMANQDLSKIMDGVQINVNADTNVDGTPLKKMSSQYTIGQINKQEMGYLMATGGRY